MKQSLIDKKVNEKEEQKAKNTHDHCLDKRTDILLITQLNLKDVFGDFLGRKSISQEQTTKLLFFSQKDVIRASPDTSISSE